MERYQNFLETMAGAAEAVKERPADVKKIIGVGIEVLKCLRYGPEESKQELRGLLRKVFKGLCATFPEDSPFTRDDEPTHPMEEVAEFLCVPVVDARFFLNEITTSVRYKRLMDKMLSMPEEWRTSDEGVNTFVEAMSAAPPEIKALLRQNLIEFSMLYRSPAGSIH